MIKRIPLTFPPGAKFYAAIGPYRSIGSEPKYICKEFDSYDAAWEYIDEHSIPEDGTSVFIKGNFEGNIWHKYGYIEIMWDPERHDFCCHSFS